MINIGEVVTTVDVQNTSTTALSNVPLTFGHVFKPGDLPGTALGLGLRAPDNSIVPCQVDVRVLHADGSVRHAVISTILPALAASTKLTYSIVRQSAASSSPAVPADFPSLASIVSIVDGGITYTANLSTLLASSYTTWLSGDIVSEWEGGVALKTSGGVEHPHLHVRFAARGYKGQSKARVDVTLENSWAWDLTPQDVTYDVSLSVGGVITYTKPGLVHFARTRWRNVAWIGTAEPTIHLSYNVPYLISTQAVPNYDQTIVPSATQATAFKNAIVAKSGPMGPGISPPYMGQAGGRPDIGILPGWAALYVIGQHPDARAATLIQGEQCGSWPIHNRDKNTGRVISLNDWPNYSGTGTAADNINPATGLSEKAPTITPATANPNSFDTSHCPDMSFIPYMVTGDIFHLEELQFTGIAHITSVNSHSSVRNGRQGLVVFGQLRGQAWGARSLAHAAYLSPANFMQAEFISYIKNNIDWYMARYVNSSTYTGAAATNYLGIFTHGFDTVLYQGTPGIYNSIGNFQDDFYTAAMGRTAELGFDIALPLLTWKAKWPVSRLYGSPGTCWVQAGTQIVQVRDGTNTDSPIYTTYLQVYNNSFSPAIQTAAQASNCATQAMADAWKDQNNWRVTAGRGVYADGVSNPAIGDMDGFSDSDQGYPSNLQPAVAYAATFNMNNANNAWQVFNGRSVKPNYSNSPQFAIVPRTSVLTVSPSTPSSPSTPTSPTTPIESATMPFADRVQTTSTSTGTGNFTVSSTPATRMRPLSDFTTGTSNVPLVIENESGTDWEESLCTILSATTFSRDTVIKGSNGTSKVDFAAGTKTVFATVSAAQLNSFLTAQTVAALGTPIPDFLASAPGGTISGSDLIMAAQGNSTVGLTALAMAVYALTQFPNGRTVPVRVTAAATIPFDSSTHNRRPIYVTVAGVTFTAPTSYANVADNFECDVVNQSSDVVTFGTGITCYGGTTLPAGGRAKVFSTNGAIFAQILNPAAAAPDTVAPTETGALVTTTTPTVIAITFSEPMNTNAVPPVSTFTASGHTLTGALSWQNSQTLLATVTTAYTNGEAASTLAYTPSGTNNLKDIAGNECAAFSGKPITNSVGVPAAVLSALTGTPTGANSAIGSVSTTVGSGTIFWLIDTNTTATATALKASSITSTVAATGTQNKTFTGLTESTTYYIHTLQVTGADSNVVNSASFATPSAGAAPFTATNRSGFPIDRSSYNGKGDGNSFYTDVVPTGAATVSAVEFFMSESNSVRPTSGTKTTSPKGDSYIATAFGPTQASLWQSSSLYVRFNNTVKTPMYFWIKVTDSNGATWWFRRNTTTNYLDDINQTYSSATEAMVAA